MMPRAWPARAGSVILAAASLFIGLCFLTYTPADVPLLSSHPQQPPLNLGGALGSWIGFIGREGFGWAAMLLPALGVVWAVRAWRGHRAEFHLLSLSVALACLLASVGTLLALRGADDAAATASGGLIGYLFARAGRYYLGPWGILLGASCVGILSWLVVSSQTLGTAGGGWLRQWVSALRTRAANAGREARASVSIVRTSETPRADATTRPSRPAPSPAAASAVTEAVTPAPMRVRINAPKPLPTPARRRTSDGFQLPSLALFADPPPVSERQLADDLQANAKILEETLRDFGVETTVANVDRGPAVTRYEVVPAPGVKLTRIVSLADDLALVLKAASCHVVAPIPGKGRVGIDVPNSSMTMVYLKEIITSPAFQQSPSPLALAIGKDVSGNAIITDLRECPHLLIAGATGSGKTVCLNSLLTGILARAGPDQVRFLMIDPKMVEMALFNNIPHLIAPVVTDAKKASAALHWAVQEMERRYQVLAQAGVRNLELFNQRCAEVKANGAGGEDAEGSEVLEPMPYLVVVIDELADLMMVASQDVEGAITRLSQLSRAVGIHIILATQRPSVDVVTGIIKANFPARIAFQVASKVDSRTILDINGADKLLGRGDLMFLRPGTAKPLRAQGAYVTDAEIERVTAFLKAQESPDYDVRFLEQQQRAVTGISTEKDELYDLAKQLVMEAGQASTSLLQRRLRLGYARAARILDLMEQEGLIGPPQGSRPREVLASREVGPG